MVATADPREAAGPRVVPRAAAEALRTTWERATGSVQWVNGKTSHHPRSAWIRTQDTGRLQFGVHSFAIDPQDTRTVYLGTSAQGLYKTTDCGATWAHINTGTNGAVLDAGRQWLLVIDPVDPQVLYTNAGYGANSLNAWKSINGGVDWQPFISAEYVKALQFGGFVHKVMIDPTQHQHLIVTPHFACEVGTVNGLPKTPNCLLETTDAGATWKILEGTPPGDEGDGQWMADAKTWFWGSSKGLWRTTNAGGSWDHVYTGGWATNGEISPGNGKLYTGGVFNVLQSSDGQSWSTIANSPGAEWVTGDAATLFVARNGSYHSAKVSDPTTWSELTSPPFANPNNTSCWGLGFDADHRVLYSLNSTAGFWRMRAQ